MCYKTLAIMEGAIQGEKVQPGESELRKLAQRIAAGQQWDRIFPGVASVNLTTDGTGFNVELRITKKEGIPVQLVAEGTPGASVVAIKRVNELDYYSLGRDPLAEKVGLSGPRTTALIKHLKLQENSDYFKQITIGRVKFNRYSQKAITRLQDALASVDMDEVWNRYAPGKKNRLI